MKAAILGPRVFAVIGIGLIWSVPTWATIINIDALRYGQSSRTPPTTPGETIIPITNPPGQPLNQATFVPGTYKITNGAGAAGANPNFLGWSFGNGSNNTWNWSFMINDNATNKIVVHADLGLRLNSQAEVATNPVVQDFSTTFTLPITTTLNFMTRDDILHDNLGGMVLNVQPVPEPATLFLAIVGLVPVIAYRRSNKR